ncbi:MAG: hypothetical protein ABUL44_04420 [Flavobacterium sp.]
MKSVLGNGLPYGILFFGLSFFLGQYLFHVALQKTLLMSSILGLSALLLNGFIYNRFSKPLKKLEEISTKVDKHELLLLEAPANHLIDDSLVPGKLFLTDRRLIFKAYEADENVPPLFLWDLVHLTPVDFSGSIWNAGGEFLFKTKEGFSLMFEVNKLKPWKDFFVLDKTTYN